MLPDTKSQLFQAGASPLPTTVFGLNSAPLAAQGIAVKISLPEEKSKNSPDNNKSLMSEGLNINTQNEYGSDDITEYVNLIIEKELGGYRDRKGEVDAKNPAAKQRYLLNQSDNKKGIILYTAAIDTASRGYPIDYYLDKAKLEKNNLVNALELILLILDTLKDKDNEAIKLYIKASLISDYDVRLLVNHLIEANYVEKEIQKIRNSYRVNGNHKIANIFDELLTKLNTLTKNDNAKLFAEVHSLLIDESFITTVLNEIKNNCAFDAVKIRQKIKEIEERENYRDVFDEAMPEVNRLGDNCRIKILFPYNKTNVHWLTGEILIEKQSDNYNIKIYAHDPYGNGVMDESNYKTLMQTIQKRIQAEHKRLFPNDPTFRFEEKPSVSPYNRRQAPGDGISCGVIVAEDIIKLIKGESLDVAKPYEVGAKQLRKLHIDKFKQHRLPTDLTRINFIKRNTIALQLSALLNDKPTQNERGDSQMGYQEKEKIKQKDNDDKEKPHSKEILSESKILSLVEQFKKSCATKEQIDCLCQIGDCYFNDNDFINAAAIYNFAMGMCDKNKIIGKDVEYIKKKIVHVENKFLISINATKPLQVHSIEQRKQELVDARSKCINEINISQPSETLHKNISSIMIAFFKELIIKCKATLGEPKGKYSIILLGSHARKVATHYSDIEFAILIEDNKDKELNKQYFRNLCTFINIVIINLGETTPKMQDLDALKFLNNSSLVKNGFSVDGRMKGACKTPLGNKHHIITSSYNRHYELICTSEELASYQSLEWFEFDSHLPATLQTYDLVEGDKNLLAEYNKYLNKYLSKEVIYRENKTTLRELMAITLLSQDINRFEPNGSKQTDEGSLYNIKYEIYRLPLLIIDHLAVIHKLKANDPWERIKELALLNIISEEGSKNLIKLIDIITRLRTMAYSFYGEQNDSLIPFKSKENLDSKRFTIPEDYILGIYYYLIPLHDVFESYYNFTASKRKVDLKEHEFYENSDFILGRIYIKLCLPEKAISYLQSAAKLYQDFVKFFGEETASIKALVLIQKINRYLALAYLQKGELDKAEEFYRRVLQFFEVYSAAQNSPSHAAIISDFADVLSEQAKNDEAKKLYIKAIAIMKAIYGDNHPDLIMTMSNYNKLLIKIGEFNEGYMISSALKIIGHKTFGKHYATAVIEGNQIAVLKTLGKNKDAEKACKSVLDNMVITYGEIHSYSLDSTIQYADILMFNKKFEEAKKYYLKALKIIHSNKKKSYELAISGIYSKLGNIEAILSNTVEALGYLDNALNVLKSDNKYERNIAVLKISKAKVFNIAKKFAESKIILLEAYHILIKDAEKQEYDIYSECLRELISVCYSIEHYNDVILYSNELIFKNESLYGEYYVKNIELLLFIQGCCMKLGQQEALVESFLKELSIRERIFGSEHEDTIELLRKIKIQYERLGKKDEAEIYSKKYGDLKGKMDGGKFIIFADSMEEHQKRKELSKVQFTPNNQNLEKAEKSLKEKAVLYGQKNIETAHALSDLAVLYGGQKMYSQYIEKCKEALLIYRQVSKTSPKNIFSVIAVLTNIGSAYLNHLNSPIESLAFFKEAKELFEKHVDLSMNLNLVSDYAGILDYYGIAYGMLNDFNKRVQYQNQAYELCKSYLGDNHSKTAQILNNLGNGYAKLQNYDMAIQCLEKALSIRTLLFGQYDVRTRNTESNIEDARRNRRLGIMSKEAKKQLAGEKPDTKVLEQLKQENISSLNQKGLKNFRQKNYKTAIETFSNAIHFSPNTAELFYNRGRAYQENGDLDLAMDDYNKAKEIKPIYAKAYYQLGVCFKQKGNFPQAETSLKHALLQDPKFEIAQKTLDEVIKSILTSNKQVAAVTDVKYR